MGIDMAKEVIMPKAGMSMETGTIIRWLAAVGDKVENGQPLLEIETDKTSMEVESMYDGTLLKILYGDGCVLPVTTTIAYIGQEGESLPEAPTIPAAGAQTGESEPQAERVPAAAPTAQGGRGIPATPLARSLAAQRGVPLEGVTATGSLGQVRAADIPPAPSRAATPLAQRMAADKGIALSQVRGSGYNGKVTAGDLPALAADSGAPLKGMRATIAKRMLQSHTQVPPVTLHMRAQADRLLAMRAEMNRDGGATLSVTDFIVRASALALAEFPRANATLEGDILTQHSKINIGVAVALEDGLIVPVIRDVGEKGLRRCSAELRELAQSARAGALRPDMYSGGTFSISNLGTYGVRAFTPIINQPEVTILGVCAIEDVFVPDENGAPAAKKMLGLSLTFDHRALDGATAASFGQRIVAHLEAPYGLVM